MTDLLTSSNINFFAASSAFLLGLVASYANMKILSLAIMAMVRENLDTGRLSLCVFLSLGLIFALALLGYYFFKEVPQLLALALGFVLEIFLFVGLSDFKKLKRLNRA